MTSALRILKIASLVALLGLLLVLVTACATPTPAPAEVEEPTTGDAAAPAGDTGADLSQLTSVPWRLTNYLNEEKEWTPVLDGTEITAVFGEDGNLIGSAGCNTYTANYESEGHAIVIGTAAATEQECAEPEGIMEQESAYLTTLAVVIAWKVEGDQLVLTDGSGSRVLLFSASETTAETVLPQETPPPLVVDVLSNTTYTSEWTPSGTAALVGGEYRESVGDGSDSEWVVRLTDDIAYLTLEDGQPAAAVILVTSPGGNSMYYDLHVVLGVEGEADDIAFAYLGESLTINSLTVDENGVIVVDMVKLEEGNAKCCADEQHVVQTFVLQRGELVPGSMTFLGTVEPQSQ